MLKNQSQVAFLNLLSIKFLSYIYSNYFVHFQVYLFQFI